jgi:hypothetical protein
MKFKILTASLLGLAMVGCASQPVNKAVRPLNEKIYDGYLQLTGKQSYAFDGELHFRMQAIQPQPAAAHRQLWEAELAQLVKQQQLNSTEQQWLAQGMVDSRAETSKAQQYLQLMETLSQRFYASFEGVVDLGHGQFSINPKFGYGSKNAQAWIRFPLALDLQNAKIYADLSALSPWLTDPQYDGRYLVYDFAALAKDHRQQLKPFAAFLREYSLVNAALTPEQNYQPQALSAEDKQAGGVERIRYQTQYQQLLQQYLLFIYLNEGFLKQSLASIERSLPKAADGSAKAAAQVPEQAAAQAAQRLNTAIEGRVAALAHTSDNATPTDSKAAVDQATPAAGDTAATKPLSTMLVDSWLPANQQDGEVQLLTALKTFDHYKTGQLIGAQQLKKIVSDNPQAYAALGNVVATWLTELATVLDLNSVVVSDAVLDAQGRFVRSETSVKFAGMPSIGLGEISGTATVNFHDYGRARVDHQALQQALPLEQALGQDHGLSKLKRRLDSVTSTAQNSQNWSPEYRYQQLASSLLNKQHSQFEVYHSVLWYAVLSQQLEELDQDKLALLRQEALFEALAYAKNQGWTLTAQQQKQWQQHKALSDQEQLIEEAVIEDARTAVAQAHLHLDLQRTLAKLGQQGQSKAQIFSRLYEQMDRAENDMTATEPYNKPWIELFRVLGKIAAQDVQTQQIDQAQLALLDEHQLDGIDVEIYQTVYQLLLETK